MSDVRDFDIFWATYPRKIKKGDARKAWCQTKAIRPPLADLVTAVERAKSCEQWVKDGGRFVPYPATWLRAEQWDDVHEVEVARPATFEERLMARFEARGNVVEMRHARQ